MTAYAPGTVIGDKYVLSRLLGEGGMGTVYAARNIELDQEVAIKILHAEVSAIPDYVTRFRREAKTCATLRGEHVARVYDAGMTDQDVPYMVMELLHGEDLESILGRKTKLPPEEAANYVLQACEGVAEAHRTRLIHRDLKPANLFLAEVPGHGSVIKVVDFGIVKQIGAEVDALTKTSTMMGTVLYMAPEQLRRRKDVDERIDIWALGVVLYELITGNVPFVGDTMPEVVAKVLEHDYIAPDVAEPGMPKGLSEVIEIALAADPANRYLTVTDFAQALAPFAGDGARSRMHLARITSLVPPSGAPRRSEIRALKPRKERGMTAPILALAALVFVGAFTAAFFAFRSGTKDAERSSLRSSSIAMVASPALSATATVSAPPTAPSPSSERPFGATDAVVSASVGSAAPHGAGAHIGTTAPPQNPLQKMRIK